jgi:tetratricopeptide (TPR) repeat protein
MKPFRRTLVITVMATVASMPIAAQPPVPPRPFLPFAPMQFTPMQKAERDAERARRMEDRRDEYQQGARALDNREYERAVSSFQRVIEAKSPRADGAYYWKAYALNKLGRRDEALAALGEIPKQFPQSRWINDAKALEAEVRQASGQGVSPESQGDEDLKLLAINSLINSDPERAVPLLEKLIQDPKNPPRLKERALFVLAQSRSDKAHEIVGQYAKGGSNPDLQLRAIEYLGTFRSKDSQQLLADVYAQSSDVNAKRAVLRGFMVSHDIEHLLNAAKNESNPDLRRDAIQWLGALRAENELSQLYASESNYDLKAAIIQGMFISGGSGKLVEIAKSDKDARLRAVAIKHLGATRKDGSEEALASMYASESDRTLKLEILNALFLKGAAKQLVDVTRAEKDPDLKKRAVQKLSMMKSKEATDYFMELLNK